MFLYFSSSELDNYSSHPEWRLTSDYVLLIITIPIIEEYIQTKKHTIIKDSKEKYIFIKELIQAIKNIDTDNILEVNSLDNIVCKLANSIKKI